jgi:hypothetical protein
MFKFACAEPQQTISLYYKNAKCYQKVHCIWWLCCRAIVTSSSMMGYFLRFIFTTFYCQDYVTLKGRLLMNDKLLRTWKEMVKAWSWSYPGIYPEGLSKIMKIFTHHNQWDSNQASISQVQAYSITARAVCSVLWGEKQRTLLLGQLHFRWAPRKRVNNYYDGILQWFRG